MRNTTFKILLIAICISVLGILSIYSSTYRKEGQLLQSLYQRQVLWVIIGVIVFQALSAFNYRRFWDLSYILYALILFFLFLVFILGIIRLGAQRWLSFIWFNFQPSEIAKVVVVIMLAKYFSRKSIDDVSLEARRLGIFRAVILPFILVAVPIGLIIEQPDFGSGVMLFLIFWVMLYLSNAKLRYALLVLAAAILSVPFVWSFLHDYQKDRIMVFLNPNIDPLGAGYTVIQSKIAIGSGGLFGKGWLSGTQSQLFFLPEAHTDFVFAAFAEEWGLFGALGLILLYYLLFRQALSIAQRSGDNFGKLLSLGIAFMISIQACVNIAMNLGLAPVVGLPLPLLSYGGSSVITTFASLGILANINKTRAVF